MRCGAAGSVIPCGENAKWYSHFGRQLVVSYKTKHSLTIQSSNHTPWYLSKGVENLFLYKAFTGIFIAVLFIIAKTWKQPRCPSVGESINKLWYIQIMEYYSVLKRSYQAMKRHGRILNAYYWVKEVNLKRLHSVGFQVYDIL